MTHFFIFLLTLFMTTSCISEAATPVVLPGIDVLLGDEHIKLLKGKRVGLITNHTAINKEMRPTRDLLKAYGPTYGYKLTALFAPEHGINGTAYAEELEKDHVDTDGTPIYSLHGVNRRPTGAMLKKIDVLIYDIQDIGSRSYTYISTLFYAMEEAAKHKIPVIVLDRPNPINGITIDGPMLEEKWRSMVGYINVPYCHGMTIGELAQFFNGEYKVGCNLTVVPMKGWHRQMTFKDTGLTWVPSSPHIPEASTALYYPTTGMLGELQIISIGVGYTLPFKVIGAPWIDAQKLAKALNEQKFPGVNFLPFHYKPFYGRFAQEECQGVQIVVTDHLHYKPVATQYLIVGTLKNLYPQKMKEALKASQSRHEMFAKVNGTAEVFKIMAGKDPVVWKLRSLHDKERKAFHTLRKKYLIAEYAKQTKG